MQEAAAFQTNKIITGPGFGEFVNSERAKAENSPESADPNELLRVRQAETAANIDRWANSSELHPPK